MAPHRRGRLFDLDVSLWDETTKEALLIDPVLEQVERDLAAAARLGLTLVGAVNTHCHADHVTSTGALKRRLPGFKSYISTASGAAADVRLSPGESVKWAGGSRCLQVRATLDTNGCIGRTTRTSAPSSPATPPIGGCGRTDFRRATHDALRFGAHAALHAAADDAGAARTTTRGAASRRSRREATHRASPRPRPASSAHGEPQLAYPKKLDVAVPANLKCGGP